MKLHISKLAIAEYFLILTYFIQVLLIKINLYCIFVFNLDLFIVLLVSHNVSRALNISKYVKDESSCLFTS